MQQQQAPNNGGVGVPGFTLYLTQGRGVGVETHTVSDAVRGANTGVRENGAHASEAVGGNSVGDNTGGETRSGSDGNEGDSIDAETERSSRAVASAVPGNGPEELAGDADVVLASGDCLPEQWRAFLMGEPQTGLAADTHTEQLEVDPQGHRAGQGKTSAAPSPFAPALQIQVCASVSFVRLCQV